MELLSRFADALHTAPPAQPGPFPASLWQQIHTRRWAHRNEVDDLAYAMDTRCDGLDLVELAKHAGYPMREVRDRPRFANANWSASKLMAAVDVGGLFILLEQLGFAIEPGPMVQSLAPAIAPLSMMTLAEAEIHTYDRMRRRQRLVLRADASGVLDERADASEVLDGRVDQWRGHAGYRYERMVMENGETSRLTITGPSYRASRRIDTTCPLCGHPYTQGDPESALGHRKAHARVQRLLAPRPNKAMRERLASGAGERVDAAAPAWLHHEVYERARRFKHDFGYDAIQWPTPAARAHRDRRWVGFVFAAPDGAIDGACAFLLRDDGWALQWVWVRPDRRRSGLLAARWSGFLAEFGDFWIECPLSAAMTAFVARHASTGQLAQIAARYPNGAPIREALP
ncbi:hypothetical protein [Duganella vulcania]|uniref:N-acetyltransferase ESCO zinc-finger domain-containing protein n=1 Tax=Duganella vulcania TaxID=2692166 RepID=A0A845GJI2_9BURK|nr:hypothetical protein [Duganella vulcania]MYM92819.1 hypothetical protein [Duganella vulcania]